MAGNFLLTGGTNGLFSAARTVTWATSLNGLASGARAISNATADTGTFTQASFNNAMWGMAEFAHITATLAPAIGGALACWFLCSRDNGATYEDESSSAPSTTVPAVARPPDFVVPLYTGATPIPAGALKWSQRFLLPNVTAKLVVQNYSGAAFSANAHTLTIFGVADGYT
jgi:hypothetical protein